MEAYSLRQRLQSKYYSMRGRFRFSRRPNPTSDVLVLCGTWKFNPTTAQIIRNFPKYNYIFAGFEGNIVMRTSKDLRGGKNVLETVRNSVASSWSSATCIYTQRFFRLLKILLSQVGFSCTSILPKIKVHCLSSQAFVLQNDILVTICCIFACKKKYFQRE